MSGRRSFETDESFSETKPLEDAESFYGPKLRPSGYDTSRRFASDNGGAIPSNCRKSAIPNLKSEIKRSVAPHPARFPEKLPTCFIQFLSGSGDRPMSKCDLRSPNGKQEKCEHRIRNASFGIHCHPTA